MMTTKGWKAELAWLADPQWIVYPHKWSPVSCRSSAVQERSAGQRPTFYHCATQPTKVHAVTCTGFAKFSLTMLETIASSQPTQTQQLHFEVPTLYELAVTTSVYTSKVKTFLWDTSDRVSVYLKGQDLSVRYQWPCQRKPQRSRPFCEIPVTVSA